MNVNEFDITNGDFNPTLLFTGKKYMEDSFEDHTHDSTEVLCILSGEQKFSIEGQLYDVTAGDIILINPGVRHHTVAIPDGEPALLFFAGFTDFSFKGMPQNCIILPDGEYILHTKAQQRQEVIGLCLNMVAECFNHQVGQYFMQKSYLIQLLMLIMRQILAEPENTQRSCHFETYHKSYVVREIRTYLNEHYTEKISLDLIAKNMYLSSAYISKIFKEETGEAPINYLIKLRLEKAKEQLEQLEEFSIKTISTSVGYEDVYYFSKLFKKYYGMSPLNYRNSLRK